MRTCVGAGVQCLFTWIGVDYVNFAPPDYNVCKEYGVRDVIVSAPRNNVVCTKAPDD